MNTAPPELGPLDVSFDATLEKGTNTGAWTNVIWADSATHFGTRGRVKVAGNIDGAPMRTSFMPLGDGRHKLPVTADILATIGKAAGDTVRIHLTERLS